MDISHADITDPYIHEPKGIATVDEDHVYVANGEGSGSWQGLPSADPTLVSPRVGTVTNFAGSTAPAKWFLCYGQTVSRETYSDLFDVIGETYGAGDGSTTFTLPDCRGRVIAGKDNMGGVSANRLTDQSGGLDGDTLGDVGGSESVTLAAQHIPTLTGTAEEDGSHTHSVSNGSSVVRNISATPGLYPTDDIVTDGRYTIASSLSVVANGEHSHDVSVNSGGGSSHNNMMPTIIMNKIIYHGVA